MFAHVLYRSWVRYWTDGCPLLLIITVSIWMILVLCSNKHISITPHFELYIKRTQMLWAENRKPHQVGMAIGLTRTNLKLRRFNNAICLDLLEALNFCSHALQSLSKTTTKYNHLKCFRLLRCSHAGECKTTPAVIVKCDTCFTIAHENMISIRVEKSKMLNQFNNHTNHIQSISSLREQRHFIFPSEKRWYTNVILQETCPRNRNKKSIHPSSK